MTRVVRSLLKIDVHIDSDLWKATGDMRPVVRRAIRQAAATTLKTDGAELAVVLTDDAAIRLLNRRWRGIDAATNVLSFPTKNPGGTPPLLGDIVLAQETVAREAKAGRKPFAHHVAHLVVHGFLHLVGYDHERDEDAERMEAAERDILRRMAIADPYGRPAPAAAKKSSAARRATPRLQP
jgi:probable rRNA maturation factor